MGLSGFTKRLDTCWKKYKYVVLVLLIGILLMVLPSKETTTEETQVATQVTTPEEESVSQKLQQILSQIDGAGKVSVMLTLRAGEETLYQTDSTFSQSDTDNSSQIDTVIITTSDKEQKGLIRQVISPEYQGAIVVCQGADNDVVKLAIVDAVSKITGLGTNQISVLKMK